MTDKKITCLVTLLTTMSLSPIAAETETTTEKLLAVEQEKNEGTALRMVFEGTSAGAGIRHVSPVQLAAVQSAQAAGSPNVNPATAPSATASNAPKKVLQSKRVQTGAVIGGALGAFLGIFSAITAGGGLALTALLFYGLIAAGAWMGGATGAVIDLMADSNDISQNSKSSPSSAKKASKDDDEPKGRNKGCIPERPTPRKPDPIDRRNPRDRF